MNSIIQDPFRTANYSGAYQKQLTGAERLSNGNELLPFCVSNFWQWAYSDILRNTQRGVFAEYVVKAALDMGGIHTNNDIRSNFDPYDLVGPNIIRGYKTDENGNHIYIESPCRIEVKSSSFVQSWDKHEKTIPRLSFRIAPARLPDETGDFKSESPQQRNSDMYVFAVYKANKKEQNIFDMELWDFYIINTSVLDDKCGSQQTISLNRLIEIGVTKTSFINLSGEILNNCKYISESNLHYQLG